MDNLVKDSSKNIAVFVNDFYQEYVEGLNKLSKKLGRHIRGVMLVDRESKEKGRYHPDKDHVFEEIVCDFSDDIELRKVIKKLEKNLLLITCGSERGQPYLQKVLPHAPHILGPTESSLSWTTYKTKMREMLHSYDPNLTPKVYPLEDNTEENVQKVLSELSFPMIVKPSGLAASILVSKVADEADLRTRLNETFGVINDIYSRDAGRGRPEVIVEEFMEGDMYSIDAYVNQHGKVWTLPPVKVITAASIGIEGYYSYRLDTNHELTEQEQKDAQEAAKHSIYALGLRSSVAHIELFKTPHGWKIIELGPRPGGYRQDMYALGYGTDHAYNELLVKAGLEPEINTTPIAHSSVFNMYADEEGVISKIEGVDSVQQLPSMQKIEVHKNIGDEALFSGNGGKLIIDGVLSNTSIDVLNNDMDHIRSKVKIHTKAKASA